MCAYTLNRSTGFMQLSYMFSRTYLLVIKRIFCSSFLFLSVPFAYVDENFESIKLCWCQFQYLQILFLFTESRYDKEFTDRFDKWSHFQNDLFHINIHSKDRISQHIYFNVSFGCPFFLYSRLLWSGVAQFDLTDIVENGK